MRRVAVVAVLVGSIVAAGCGGSGFGGGGSGGYGSAPTPAPTSPVAPDPAASPRPEPHLAILRGDGVAGPRFGQPIGEVVAWFTDRFGPPDDEVAAHDTVLFGYLSDDPDVAGRIGVASWGSLQVVFLDRSGEVAPDALPFVAWTLGWGGGDVPVFTTPEGVGLGSTLADLRDAYGRALHVPGEPAGPCGISWVFTVATPVGPYHGTFSHEPRTPGEHITMIGAGLQPSC